MISPKAIDDLLNKVEKKKNFYLNNINSMQTEQFIKDLQEIINNLKDILLDDN